MENYRTFIGIPLKVEKAFLHERSSLIRAMEGERISWVVPGNFHLTLRFLGEQSLEVVGNIRAAMQGNLALPPFRTLRFSDLGYFSSQRAPRVLWVGVEEKAYLEELRERVEELLRGFGFGLEEQEYRPHLTLGRIRRLENREGFFRELEQRSEAFRSAAGGQELVLFRSRLSISGAVYTPLASVPLDKA